MKRKRVNLKEAEMDLPLVPLIDVLMQLLIFFMCGTKFRTLEGKLLAHMPKDRGVKVEVFPPPPPPPPNPEVRIRLIYDEAFPPLNTRIGVQKTGESKTRPVADWHNLHAVMEQYHKEVLARNVEVDFIIDPDEQIPAQSVVNALDACRQANISDVIFAAKTAVTDGLDGRPKKRP